MTKRELIEMLTCVPDNANIKLWCINKTINGKDVVYNNLNGFIKLTDCDYALTDINVQPRIL